MPDELDSIFNLIGNEFPAAGLPCLMIGGHAVNHYGVLRATQDVDFMIAAGDAPCVRTLMSKHGYTNVAEHESVFFFNRPGSALRIDFLLVNAQTLSQLLENAVNTDSKGESGIRVPRLLDLIAMKLFSIRSGGPRRMDKDLPDIVNLIQEHGLDLERDVKPLCEHYGNDSLFQVLKTRLEGNQDA